MFCQKTNYHIFSQKLLTKKYSYAKLTQERLVQTNQSIGVITMNLTNATEGKEYIIKDIHTDDAELESFLFSLGCYSGEPITVVSQKKSGCIVYIKEGRYSIDKRLASNIII